MSDNAYTRKLIALSVRVNLLEKKIDERRIDLEAIQKKINSCKSLLSKIYEHAEYHKIDLRTYSDILIQIETKLSYTKERFIKRMSPKKSPRYKKILHIFFKVLGFISSILNLLGIGSLPSLPGKEFPKLSE